jgi:Transglycosylase-like domain
LRVPTRRIERLTAAAIATVLLLGIIGPGVALAKDPPGLGKFMNAIGKVESGGSYRARNRTSGAYGKYQIMPSNWPSWARRYLGNSKAKPTPANQERVARGKFKTLYKGLKSWRRVAYWWLTGSSRKTGWSSYANRYVRKVMTAYATASSRVPSPGRGSPSAKFRRYSERSPSVAYAGGWRIARHGAYAGDAVRYSTRAGSTATITFTGRGITWYGPVGPTRGEARLSIDGRFVKTVTMHRRGFDARAAVFSRSWSKRGPHTLTITVVGRGGHPMVAIDEFLVRR